MDEYTADPVETEREAQDKLKKIKFNQARAEVSKIAQEVKAENAKANEYTKSYSGNTRGGVSGGEPLMRNKAFERNPTYKTGGSVSSASKRADGCCIKGKTRA